MKLNQSIPELTVNWNNHSILQKGVPSSAACYVKDHILPFDAPEFLLFFAETANNWALPTVSILPTTLHFFQIFPNPPDLWTEE